MVLLNHQGQETPAQWQPWDGNDIPEEHRILGMGTIEITVRYLQRTVNLLQDLFHYTVIAEKDKEMVLQSIEGKCMARLLSKN